MSAETVLVLGATSGIAKAVAQVLAKRGCGLIIAGRNEEELRRHASDLEIRYGVKARAEVFDALDYEGHGAFVERCGPLDGVVLCYGYMTDQAETQRDFAAARRTIEVNFLSAVSLLMPLANAFEARGQGWIAAISSVAADRGRQSNYTYGASKAALSAYLQGLRNRLFPRGVHVLEIKPGFVDTPMTRGLLNPKSPLVASPERVAVAIDKAIRKRKDVAYTPWFWWGIMTIIRSIPELLFKRLKL